MKKYSTSGYHIFTNFVNHIELKSICESKPTLFCREKIFKKIFPINYNDLLEWKFPNEFTWSQKLYHYINNDKFLNLGLCKICNNRSQFISLCKGYQTYCSRLCSSHDQSKIDKWRKSFYDKSDDEMNEIKNKMKNAHLIIKDKISKTQTEIWNNRNKDEKNIIAQKRIETLSQRSPEFITEFRQRGIEKVKENWKRKTEEEKNIIKTKHSLAWKKMDESKIEEFLDKVYKAKKKNNTFGKSKIEEEFNQYLIDNNYTVIRQYKDKNKYPFQCDFYLPKYDLYLEIQGNWTHGKHPFNENDENDINTLNIWKSKSSPFYKKAIEDWTVRDVNKRETAKRNNLNFLEIFSCKINIVIDEFEKHISNL